MRSIRATLAALAASVALAAAAPAAAEPAHEVRRGDVTVTCPLTVGGSFAARTAAVRGRLTLGATGDLGGTFEVDLATLDTGIDLRNRHLRENYLEVDRGAGFAAATLAEVKVEAADLAAFSGKAPFQGQFTVHGQTREVKGTVEVRREGEVYHVVASFPLSVSSFEIAKPRYLGVGVKDEVRVEVSLEVAPAASGDPS